MAQRILVLGGDGDQLADLGRPFSTDAVKNLIDKARDGNAAESLEIQYASLSLSAPDKGLFKYQMEGYETAWTERPGTIRSARYPKLPHGHYKFRVKAYNEDKPLHVEEQIAL